MAFGFTNILAYFFYISEIKNNLVASSFNLIPIILGLVRIYI